MSQSSSDLLSAIMAASATTARVRAAREGAAVERVAATRQPRGGLFRERLSSPGYSIIAECKRRSPSKGILRVDYDPAAIARGFTTAGAAAISVLTETAFFDGALAHLEQVRAAVDVPVLRKDFLSDEFQLIEARAAGADAILLIVAGLDDGQLMGLLRRARTEGLAALVEVHDREELTRALDAGADIVGVNSRNLKTLDVYLGLHEALAAGIPDGVIAVAESGLRTAGDLKRLSAAGYHAFLIGEHFMAANEPGAALGALLESGA